MSALRRRGPNDPQVGLAVAMALKFGRSCIGRLIRKQWPGAKVVDAGCQPGSVRNVQEVKVIEPKAHWQNPRHSHGTKSEEQHFRDNPPNHPQQKQEPVKVSASQEER